jgi:hypothetical protein
MLNIDQRDRIRAALEARAFSANKLNSRKLRRVAGESRLFDRFVEREYKRLKRANPGAGDGEILKMLLDFIQNGGLEQIIKVITTILALFA